MLYKKRCFDQKNVEKRIRAGRGLPFFHAQEANQAKSIRDGNPEQTEQTSKSVCLPAVAANCSLRLATQCQFQRFQCEVESKQPDTRLAQYLRHKSTVSLPPNLTECSLSHFMPALRLLKPHVSGVVNRVAIWFYYRKAFATAFAVLSRAQFWLSRRDFFRNIFRGGFRGKYSS